jgi:hypothetical protein
MLRIERGGVAHEQLLVLWTLLLEGHVPVPHIVAELEDEPDAVASSAFPHSSSNTLPAAAQTMRREAA